MTGLLVLITILLFLIIVWMIAITLLYLSIFRSVKKLAEVDGEAVKGLFERQEGLLKICQEVLNNFQLVEEFVEKYKEDVEKEINNETGRKEFALQTIQQARRLQNALEEKLGKINTEPYKYEEPEEDPEDPRS